MFTKWLIEGLENYVVTDSGDIYRKPIIKNNKSYSWRLIKKQYPNRWRLNNEWYSKTQLRPKLYLNPNPEQIHEKTPW